MIETNAAAVTALTGYAVMFAAWMEAFLKPTLKQAGARLRSKYWKESVGEQAKDEQDKQYNALLHGTFRAMTILMGIAFVWGNDIGVSFFEVFNLEETTKTLEYVNWATTGAVIGLGNRGVHFMVDLFETVFRFTGRWFQAKAEAVNAPE